ncbi:uncharacterized protein LOC117793412 [Drosophila innubila]|uniref:uncharacterized protein LOC117793412 n=1 Tax=Drosophila innubila TaxID=198719 RepID=UPI00148C9927|nr:uncharacterized protein LOC117793412 [Drosophila innubila]
MANQLPTPLLLLFIGFSCMAITIGQRLPLPTLRLMAPSFSYAESFERFDSLEDDVADVDANEMQRAGQQLNELVGRQLTSAVAPLSAVPFLGLARRQPGIVAPRSGVEAALRFADSGNSEEEEESSEEDSEEPQSETDAETEPETDAGADTAQEPHPQTEYNPYRDNFNDQNADGSYVYGYSLPNGVRRWERGYHLQQQNGLVVEGFYAQPRQVGNGKGVEYELRCYRADSHGYHPLAVEYLAQPPRVRRFELPNLRCFNANRLRR